MVGLGEEGRDGIQSSVRLVQKVEAVIQKIGSLRSSPSRMMGSGGGGQEERLRLRGEDRVWRASVPIEGDGEDL